MPWQDTLVRWVTGSRRPIVMHEAIPELQRAHDALRQRAAQMRQHAETAPNHLSQEELRRLADEDEAEAGNLAAAIANLGAQPAKRFREPMPAGTLNHWGRLVQDLEAHRVAIRALREEAIHFADTVPEASEAFERACQAEDAHAVRIRNLIARTDPQALD
jgi:hypothetical protein